MGLATSYRSRQINPTPNDQILFAFGDCIMKGQTRLKTYSSAYHYLVTKLRSLGHGVVFYPERFTSQRFRMTGTQIQFNKDIMAGQNSSILGVCDILGFPRPEYLEYHKSQSPRNFGSFFKCLRQDNKGKLDLLRCSSYRHLAQGSIFNGVSWQQR
jgi:hypothetical protein